MKKIIIIVAFVSGLYADTQSCLKYYRLSVQYMDELNEFTEAKMYRDAYLANDKALRYLVKSKVSCRGVKASEKLKIDETIDALKSSKEILKNSMTE